MEVLSKYSGFIIIFQFLVCSIYIRLNSEGITYKQLTLSGIASSPKYTNFVRVICWSVCLLILPFLLGLKNEFNLRILSLPIVSGIFASIGLFFTALTINKPKSILHYFSSFVFYIFMSILPIHLSIILLLNNGNLLGAIILFILFISSCYSIWNLYKTKLVSNGITELIFMSSNAFWVLIFSSFIFFN
jgi:hypothetical protein